MDYFFLRVCPDLRAPFTCAEVRVPVRLSFLPDLVLRGVVIITYE